MSVGLYGSSVKRLRRTLETLQKADAGDIQKESRLSQAISRLTLQASKASSAESARNYRRQAETKQGALERVQRDRAQRAQKIVSAQSSLMKGEQKLHDAQRRKRERQAKDAELARKRESEKAKREQRRRDLDQAQRDQQRAATEMSQRSELDAVRAKTTELEERLLRSERANAPEEITVLFLAATPEDQEQIRISKEAREIQKRVRVSEHRDSIFFEWRMARQLVDLIQDLSEVEPHILHFSGHGSRADLVFEDAGGNSTFLTNEQLDSLLEVSSNKIRLVVFNSCNSADQAELAIRHVELAIGMDETIADEAAKVFAGQFYASLGFGRSVQKAFEEAKLQMDLEVGSCHEVPRLYAADGVDPSTVVLVSPDCDGHETGAGS